MNKLTKAVVVLLGLLMLAVGWKLDSGHAIQYTYPAGATTSQTISSGNKAAANAVATLPAVAGKVTYIEGFYISSGGSTGAALVTVTITGTTNTLSYTYGTIAGATLSNPNLEVKFPTPIPASAVNTAIVVTCPSLGTGNTNATVVAYGFSQ
jgi:hypothetical protein